MKITRRPINASAQVAIPAPFDEYYTIMPDNVYEELTGTPAKPSPCEEANYGMKHIYYLTALPEWKVELDDIGLREVELVREGNDILVCFNVRDRVFRVDPADLPGRSVDDELEDAFGDDPVAGIATMFGIDYETGELIFDWYFNKGIAQQYDSVRDLLDFVNEDIYSMLDEYGDEDLKEEILSNIEGCSSINGATKTGLEYWYYSRHGMGPGTIPRGVQVLDWYEEGYKTWMLLDHVLHTDELNYYDLKEETPPAGSITHNGTVIEGSSNIGASEATKISEDENSIEYVVASDDDDPEEKEWFVVDSPIPDRDFKQEMKRWAQRELDDEADAYDLKHGEGKYQDMKGNSLDRIDVDKLRSDLEEACNSYLTAAGFTSDDMLDCRVTVRRGDFYNGDCIECKVMAELDYDEFTTLIYDYLNPVIQQKYDQDAYFEHDMSGVIVGIMWASDRIVAADSINAADDSAAIDRLREKLYIDPDYDINDDETRVPDDITIDIPFDCEVIVNEDTSWELVDDSFLEDYAQPEISFDSIKDDFEFIFTWATPADPGKYQIKGKVVLFYEADVDVYGEPEYTFVAKRSSAVASEINPAGKVEESTKSSGENITAANEVDGPLQDVDVDIECKLIVNDDSTSGWTLDDASYTAAWEPYKDEVADLGLDIDEVMQDLGFAIATEVPHEPGTYNIKIKAHLSYIDNKYDPHNTRIIDVQIAPEGEPFPDSKGEAMMTEDELDKALLEGKPFDLASFKKYKVNVGKDVLTADKIDVGDVICITETAEEVNLGTVVKILAINDPAEDWIDYVFRVEIVSQPSETQLPDGSVIDLHFDADELVGSLVLN